MFRIFRAYFDQFLYFVSSKSVRHLRMNVKQLINFKDLVHPRSRNIFFVIFTHSLHSTRSSNERIKTFNDKKEEKNLPTHRCCRWHILCVQQNVTEKLYASGPYNYERFSDPKQHIRPALLNCIAGKKWSRR